MTGRARKRPEVCPRLSPQSETYAFSWAKPRRWSSELFTAAPAYFIITQVSTADLCESVWRRRMAPALSTTYMVALALLKYVKQQRRKPVLEVLVRFLQDKITKAEVHIPLPLSPPPAPVHSSVPPPPLPCLTKVCLLTPQRLHAPPQLTAELVQAAGRRACHSALLELRPQIHYVLHADPLAAEPHDYADPNHTWVSEGKALLGC